MRLRLFLSCVRIATLLLLFSVAPDATLAQEAEPTVFFKLDYTPLESGSPTVKVRVNDQELTFLLDTGAEATFLLDATVRRLKLPLQREKVAPKTMTDAERLTFKPLTAKVEVKRFQMGDQLFEDISMAVVEKIPSAIRKLKIDGFLGMSLLEQYAIVLDPASRQFTFVFPGDLTPATLQRLGFDDVKPQPMESSEDRYAYFTEVEFPHQHKIKLLLDTGASSVLCAFEDAKAAGLGYSKNVQKMQFINGQFPLYNDYLPFVKAGDVTLRLVRITHPDAKTEPPAKTLGMPILSRVKTLMDFPAKKIYYKPLPDLKPLTPEGKPKEDGTKKNETPKPEAKEKPEGK